MNLKNKFKAKQIPVMALAVACGAMAVMTPDWRNELQAAGYGTQSGTVCKGYSSKTSESSSSKIGYLPNAVVNLNSRSAQVICPLGRATDNDGDSKGTATAKVYVQYPEATAPSSDSRENKPKPPVPATTSCTLYSYTVDGVSLAEPVKGTTDVTGIISLSLVDDGIGDGISNADSNYTVVCTLPGASKASITGITLVED